jgi:hypothetical protein
MHALFLFFGNNQLTNLTTPLVTTKLQLETIETNN